MTISSRTPEGDHNRCPLCGKSLRLEPSVPPGDAPCPHCGHLLWFADDDKAIALATDRLLGRAHFSHLEEIVETGDLLDYIGGYVPVSVVAEQRLVPVYETMDALVMAGTDPINSEGLDKIQFILNRKILFYATTPERLQTLVDRYCLREAEGS